MSITKYFQIDAKTAEIFTNKSNPDFKDGLDLESLPSNNFLGELIVTDSGGLSDTALLNLTVFDINDHVPRFSKHKYYIELSEETPAKTIIFQAKAKDLDKVHHLQYRFIAGPSSSENNNSDLDKINDMFEINLETGFIFLKKKLDYEDQNSFTLYVEVTDGQFSSNIRIYIKVIDINDSRPVWKSDQQLTFYLNENSPMHTKIYKFQAIDHDTNSNLKYKVMSTTPVRCSSWFNLDSESGVLTSATSHIDREVIDKIVLYIAAIDVAGKTKGRRHQSTPELRIVINIRDVNDNYPHIQSNPLYIEMEEESPVNKTVLCLNEYVTDNDFGQHAVLKYELHGQEEFFTIDEKTGCITTKRIIDREILPSYWENTLETPVRICDNQKSDDIEILEIENDVFAKFSKDEENKAAIQAKIRAEKVKKENYNNQLCIKAIVKVMIKDVLDKKPTWSSKIRKTTKFNVYEDSQIGNEIGKIPLATDLDEQDPVDYCMINEELNLPFKLYDDVLTLVGQVDYEKKKEYQIYVHAINSKDFGTCALYRRFLELKEVFGIFVSAKL